MRARALRALSRVRSRGREGLDVGGRSRETNPEGGGRAMRSMWIHGLAALLLVGVASADEEVDAGEKKVSGMSIVGNDEAPKSLVIVPWKTAALGESLEVSRSGGDEARPVDREVFVRQLDYYEIRTGQAR